MPARSAVIVISAVLAIPGAAMAAPLGPAPTGVQTRVAAPAWGPVVKLAKNPMGSALATDRTGTVTAVWEAPTWPRSIVVRQHAPGHAWTKARTIGHGSSPVLGVDATGGVTVAWVSRRVGFSDGVMAARHPAGGTWSTPVRISADAKIAGYPTDGDDVVGASDLSLAVGPKTGVVVAWSWGSDNRPKPYRVQAAILPPGGHWQKPVAVTPANGSDRPRVGIAGDGTTYVVFTGTADNDTRWPLKVRQRSPHGVWSAAKVLAPTNSSWRVDLAVNRGGDVVVGYYSGFQHMSVVYKRRDTGWQPRERVAPGVDVQAFSVGLIKNGAVVAALSEQSGGVDVVRRRPSGTWSALQELDSEMAPEVSLATDPRGDILVCWGYMALYASYFPQGGDWTPRDTVSPYSDALEGFHTAIDADGDAAVLWDQEGAQLKVRQLTS